MNQGKFDEALQCCIETLTKLDEILCPPYRDYVQCQEGARRCFLTQGNVTYKPIWSKESLLLIYIAIDNKFLHHIYFVCIFVFVFHCQRRQSNFTLFTPTRARRARATRKKEWPRLTNGPWAVSEGRGNKEQKCSRIVFEITFLVQYFVVWCCKFFVLVLGEKLEVWYGEKIGHPEAQAIYTRDT